MPLAGMYNLLKYIEREVKKGNCNRAMLAVARKLVSYMLAVDKRGTEFVQPVEAKAA